MDLFRMKCFVAVVEHKSITRAAEMMNITQPAMSFQIRELEKELGMKLFERDKKGIFPTDAGLLLRDGFIQLLFSYDKLIERARFVSGGKRRLVIGYHGPVSWAGVPEFISDFSSRHPDIEIIVMQQHWKELASFLKIGAIDIGFLNTDEIPKEHVSRTIHLFREHTCFAISEDDPLSERASLCYKDIKDRRICMNNYSSPSMDAMIQRLYTTGIKREQMLFSDLMESTIAMAACRQGLASLPRSFKLDIPGLVHVDYEPESAWLDYSLVSGVNGNTTAAHLFMSEAAGVKWPYGENA